MTIWILKTGSFQSSMARATSLSLGSYPPSVSSNWEELRKSVAVYINLVWRETVTHSTIKFMAKISDKKINILHATIFKGE